MFNEHFEKGLWFTISFLVSMVALAQSAEGERILTKSRQGIEFSSEFQNKEGNLIIVAAGDVLLHRPLHEQAMRDRNGHKSLWFNTLPIIQGADMAYANLEGPVAPGVLRSGRLTQDPGNRFDNVVYTSFPQFNYHSELVEDLKDSGFDVVSTANNHAMDRGTVGVDATIKHLHESKLQFTGTKTRVEAATNTGDWSVILEQKGFRIAWLACTFGTNGIPDSQRQVLGCFRDQRVVLEEIKRLAQDRSIDAIIVTPHTGNEYEDVPNAQSVKLYRSFIDAGARAVIGAHPHVLQPWEKYTSTDGREGLILYSLGNFVSGQFHKLKTRATIILVVELSRDHHGNTVLAGARYVPLEMTRQAGFVTLKVLSNRSGSSDLYHHITSMFGLSNLLQFNDSEKTSFGVRY